MKGADTAATILPRISPVHPANESRSSDDGHRQAHHLEPDERQALELVEEAIAAISRRDDELRHLQERLERLLLVAPPVALIDRDGIVRAWSRALERLTCTSASNVLGRRLGPQEAGWLIDGGRWSAGDGQAWRAQTHLHDRWHLVVLEPEPRDVADARTQGLEATPHGPGTAAGRAI